jgi:hypothetical protein
MGGVFPEADGNFAAGESEMPRQLSGGSSWSPFAPARDGVAATVLVLVFAAAMLFGASHASALPAYARQTGQQCAACHNGFPELTPYGRLFKLNGYTFGGGGEAGLPRLSGMVIPTFTHTDTGEPGNTAHYGPNNNFDIATASLFYGGAIAPNLGAFAQLTYDDGPRQLHWDNTDIRYARATTLFDREVVFGASLNNNPTVTDVWNTTPAWGYPYESSQLALTPAAGTLIGGFAQQVVGVTSYAYVNRFYYAELGFYRTFSPRMETTLGASPFGPSIKGLAPYWRFAVEPQWGRSTWEFGTFGMAASLNPGRITGFGTDHSVDVGLDTEYQFLADRHSVSVMASWITENDTFTSTAAQLIAGGVAGPNTHDHLRTLNVKTSYFYNQTYGGTLGFFRLDGSGDPNLYPAGQFSGSATASPNSQGWIAELNYIPFNHGGPSFWPWLNVKYGLQYVYYTKFNGSSNNYDGFGRNASDNNTLFLFAWLAF